MFYEAWEDVGLTSEAAPRGKGANKRKAGSCPNVNMNLAVSSFIFMIGACVICFMVVWHGVSHIGRLNVIFKRHTGLLCKANL